MVVRLYRILYFLTELQELVGIIFGKRDVTGCQILVRFIIGKFKLIFIQDTIVRYFVHICHITIELIQLNDIDCIVIGIEQEYASTQLLHFIDESRYTPMRQSLGHRQAQRHICRE